MELEKHTEYPDEDNFVDSAKYDDAVDLAELKSLRNFIDAELSD